jgi:hypothetical protein
MNPFAYAMPEYERQVMTGRLMLAHPGCLELVSSEGAAEPLTREQVAARFPVTDDRCAGCGGKLDGPPVSLGVMLDADEDFVKPMGAA